ncbi:hypothetical protein ABID22_003617 [Pontibacter aydingkolensis]|uniref:Uncharacterized protein n=1 Tax=Pontibacter aydingkolensis TaxID=1911536 RepID=A0ABS7CYJ1_9BACT|nr:hypothetical protein [Pontibacter aydingkolensis]MBW7468929.1 hypothetical protein [Pontibacter aydingkolensis]
MDMMNLDNWDEERYKELNTYFRIRIEQMLRTDTLLQEQMQQSDKLHLHDLVAYFSDDDKERWEEFMALDQLKMQKDMWDHLHGKGTRFKPGQGFVNPDDDTTW